MTLYWASDPNKSKLCTCIEPPWSVFSSAFTSTVMDIVDASAQYAEPAATATVDPYSDAYNAPPAPPATNDHDAAAPRGRSRSRSPARSNGERSEFKSPSFRRRSPPPRRPPHAPVVSPCESCPASVSVYLRFPAGPFSIQCVGSIRVEYSHSGA